LTPINTNLLEPVLLASTSWSRIWNSVYTKNSGDLRDIYTGGLCACFTRRTRWSDLDRCRTERAFQPTKTI